MQSGNMTTLETKVIWSVTYKSFIPFFAILVVLTVATWVTTAGKNTLSFIPEPILERWNSGQAVTNRTNQGSNLLTLSVEKSGSLASGCHFTQIDPYDPEILKLIKKYPPINCTGYLSLVYIDGDILRVNLTKVKTNPKAKDFYGCHYTPFSKSIFNDNTVFYGKISIRFKEKITLKKAEEFVMTECFDKLGRPMSRSYLSRIDWDETRDKNQYTTVYTKHFEKYAPMEKFNLLLVGIDGLSEGNFVRSMPKTKDYLLRNLNAIRLEKYNKVGLNTFPNIMPMLTGHSVHYFLKNWTKKEYFDKINHHFIWSEFQKAGYRTALDLEEKHITAFHYLKRGWKKSPVDHYSRPLTIVLDTDKVLKKTSSLCKGDKPSISIHNDFLLQLSSRYNKTETPYFAFSFLTRLTHDDQNIASAGDDLYLQFLQQLHKTNVFNNTVVLVFSDHGERFGSIRVTFTGVIESKTPIGYFILPPWFESKYPDIANTLRTNAQRLVSPFDLHATFRDLLYFQSNSKPTYPDPGPGISLLQPFPQHRNCTEAVIPTVYCNCNSLTQPKVDENIKQQVSLVITDTINKKLSGKKDCQKLFPDSIHSFLQVGHPAKDRLRQEVVKSTSVLYHVSLLTLPGKGLFEAMVEVNKGNKKMEVLGSISRLNMYKGEKDCVQDSVLRPFCYCG